MSGPENTGNEVFRDDRPHDAIRDTKLVARAIRAGWLSPEKRATLQMRCFELAVDLADPSTAKQFVAVASLAESMYQFDIKLAERQEERDLKNPLVLESRRKPSDVPTATPTATEAGTMVTNVDERKRQLAERIKRLAGVGGDASGTGVCGEPAGET